MSTRQHLHHHEIINTESSTSKNTRILGSGEERYLLDEVNPVHVLPTFKNKFLSRKRNIKDTISQNSIDLKCKISLQQVKTKSTEQNTGLTNQYVNNKRNLNAGIEENYDQSSSSYEPSILEICLKTTRRSVDVLGYIHDNY